MFIVAVGRDSFLGRRKLAVQHSIALSIKND